jgi:hypothetical protein
VGKSLTEQERAELRGFAERDAGGEAGALDELGADVLRLLNEREELGAENKRLRSVLQALVAALPLCEAGEDCAATAVREYDAPGTRTFCCAGHDPEIIHPAYEKYLGAAPWAEALEGALEIVGAARSKIEAAEGAPPLGDDS